MSCEPPEDSLGAQASQGRADEGIGPYVFCRRTDCDRRDPSERVKPVYPLVRNGIFYTTAPQERYRAIPNGVAIPDQLAHALAVGPADHALPAGAKGTVRWLPCRYRAVPKGRSIPVQPCTHRLRRLAARESACPPADRCSWHRNAPLSSRTGFPDSKSAGCPSPDP